MMEALGLPDEFRNRIEECITTVTYGVLINGASTGFIQPHKGLRQGDPMSSFLFLICAERIFGFALQEGGAGCVAWDAGGTWGMSMSH